MSAGRSSNFFDHEIRRLLIQVLHLIEVVVVDSCRAAGSRPTHARFLTLIERLWPERRARIHTLGDFIPELEDGVSFSDREQLVAVVDDLVRHLSEEGRPPHEILIDVTSGTKLVTAAGGAVALADGRRFQYVDTHTYEVMTFEPAWAEEVTD